MRSRWPHTTCSIGLAIGVLLGAVSAKTAYAANVEAAAVYLCVGFDDVTDSTAPGETVYYGGGLFWSDLTTDEITIKWYMDGSYLGGLTLTGVPASGNNFFYQGGGRTWLATAGNHTISMVVDADGLIAESDETDNIVARPFTVSANSDPTDITIASSSVDENEPAGTTVGSLSTTDPDAGDTHTYSLVSGTGDDDNVSFSVSGSNLLTAASFNYESKSNYTVRVRTTDQGSLSYEEALPLTITDVLEPPPEFDGVTIDGTDAILQWSSIANHTYILHDSTSLTTGFAERATGILATPPMNTYTDALNGVSVKFWQVTTEE